MDTPSHDPAACPDDEILLAYAGGYLPEAEASLVASHVGGCDLCCAMLAEVGRALADERGDGDEPDGDEVDEAYAPPARRRLPEPGDLVGRYHVIEVLGRGAMGVVYTAYDPELDRRIALKLVRVEGPISADARELEARLLAEAQAMARLSHRNVVTVHDIGTVDAGIYIAMELVVGRTLRAWLDEAPHTWREIVDVFLQAGDGLAAAHAANIVHRDFKPDNVLIERGGRVLVTDFGLARVAMRELPGVTSAVPSSDLRKTRAGTVIGTPAYMAPEQLVESGAVDARADVFAFGATLYEALWRARPYAGATLEELARSLATGEPQEPPAAPKVPAFVRRVVTRALQGKPEARYQTMPALLQALRADPRRRLLRVAVPFVALALLAGSVLAIWQITTAPARACREGAERAALVWSPERQEVARAAFTATGQAYAPEAFALASAGFEAHLARWQAARVDACDATHERGEQSEALLDRRLRCLDDRLAEAEALAGALERADAATVERASEAVSRLPEARICGEVERLEARVPPPVEREAAAKVEAAQALRAQAEAAELTGRFEEGLARARSAAELASAAGYGPLEADATVLLARLTFVGGTPADARALYEKALRLGLAAGDDRVVAEAALGLADVVGSTTRTAEEALRWVGIAEAENERLGGERDLAVAALRARSEAHFSALESEEALATLERAIALAGEDGAGDSELLERLAAAYQQVERYDLALATYEKALAADTRDLGPRHPKTLATASDYGGCLASAGHYAAAEARLREALALAREVYPKPTRALAMLIARWGYALWNLGRFDEGEAAIREARVAAREALGDDVGLVAIFDTMLAQGQAMAGQGEGALATIAEGLAINDANLGGNVVVKLIFELLSGLALERDGRTEGLAGRLAKLEEDVRTEIGEGSELAMALDLAGRDLTRAGRAAEAIPKHEAALAMSVSRYGEDNLETVLSRTSLAQALAASGREGDARAAFEKVLAILAAEPSNPLAAAEAEIGLAAVVRAADPARADALIAAARERLAGSPYPWAARLRARIAPEAPPAP
ncbi:MAG: tetratricopeptide repeat protein [Deltaproteobacteria bacterium]|nr:tetratricopeptide repeat protein [Deltaproteobacteria bacterium]